MALSRIHRESSVVYQGRSCWLASFLVMKKTWVPCRLTCLVLLPQCRMSQQGRAASMRTVASTGWRWRQSTSPGATRPCRPPSPCARRLAGACSPAATAAAAVAAGPASAYRACMRTFVRNWRWAPARRRAWRRRGPPWVTSRALWAPPTSPTRCSVSHRGWCVKPAGLPSRISSYTRRTRKWSRPQGASGRVTGFPWKVCYTFTVSIAFTLCFISVSVQLSQTACFWWCLVFCTDTVSYA